MTKTTTRTTIRLRDTVTGHTATVKRLPSLPGSSQRMYSVGMMMAGQKAPLYRPHFEQMSRDEVKAMMVEMAGRVAISREG